MNLYKKIYEAIDNGIQKALIISDNQDNDTSIRWKEKEISASPAVLKMNNYVNEFIKVPNNELYKNILNLSLNGIKYKINTFNEFKQICNNCYSIIGNKYHNTLMKWLDMSNIVTIILNSGKEISIDLYDENCHNVIFVKFKNIYANHDIILHKNLLMSEKRQHWGYAEDKIDFNADECIYFDNDLNNEDLDYDGYNHTYNNINYCTHTQNALNFCQMQSMHGYACYLPALGEIKFIVDNADTIFFDILTVVGNYDTVFNNYNDFISSCIWTSSEQSYSYAWYKDENNYFYPWLKEFSYWYNEDNYDSEELDIINDIGEINNIINYSDRLPIYILPMFKKI